MNDCEFTLSADNYWVCKTCHWKYPRKLDNPPQRSCSAKITDEDRAQIMRTEPDKLVLIPLTPEQKAEAERQQKEAAEAGAKLGWTPAMVLRYARALVRWTAAGCPQRTDEEVDEIVKICEDCKPYYKADSGRCSKCGCRINASNLAIKNKARMKTEHCMHPDGSKW